MSDATPSAESLDEAILEKRQLMKEHKALAMRRKRWWRLGLGIVGWLLIVANMPFGWELPTYANY